MLRLIPCSCELRQSNHTDGCCRDMHEDVRAEGADGESGHQDQDVWNEGKQESDSGNPAIQSNRACCAPGNQGKDQDPRDAQRAKLKQRSQKKTTDEVT